MFFINDMFRKNSFHLQVKFLFTQTKSIYIDYLKGTNFRGDIFSRISRIDNE